MELKIRKRTPEELEEKLIELNNEIALLKHDNKVLEEQLTREVAVRDDIYTAAHHNWNKLKEWLEEENKKTFIDIVSISAYQKILSKMQEIKGGVDSEQ